MHNLIFSKNHFGFSPRQILQPIFQTHPNIQSTLNTRYNIESPNPILLHPSPNFDAFYYVLLCLHRQPKRQRDGDSIMVGGISCSLDLRKHSVFLLSRADLSSNIGILHLQKK